MTSSSRNNYDPHEFQQQAETLIPAVVRMFSGCHSEQTSADVSNVGTVAQLPDPAGRAGGACTSALLDILYTELHNQQAYGKVLTFQDLLVKLRKSLVNGGFSQIPQLTSSRPLDVQEMPFHIVGGTGARRALLVGINYCGQNGQLNGCHNDVLNVKKYLQYAHGFPEQGITTLLDDGRSNAYPTRQRIIAELRRLVVQSRAGDSVFFHFSGHGGLISPEFNFFKSSANEYDETIYPVDHERSGQIRDFSLFNYFVKPMAAGVTVTCIMDCCHSGSVLDLPYTFLPIEGGEIQMRQSLDILSNLAFLYVLAGGLLPAGFEGISDHIEAVTGAGVEDFQGCGIESAAEDEWTGEEDIFGGIADDAVAARGVEDELDDSNGGVADVFGPGEPVASGEMYDAVTGYAYGDGTVPDQENVTEQDFGGNVDHQGGEDGGENIDCGCLGDAICSLLENEEE